MTHRFGFSLSGAVTVGLLLIVTLFCPAAFAETKYECSKSEKFYRELEAAGVHVWGRDAQLPKEPAWEALLPIYRKLRDYDVSAASGENCQASLRSLRKQLIQRIVKYSPFLKVTIADPAKRFNGLATVTIDGDDIEKPDKIPLVQLRDTAKQDYAEIPGHPLTGGKHRIRVVTPRLDANEKVVVQAVLDGVFVGESKNLELDIEVPPGGRMRVHHLEIKLQLVRECRVSLNISGNLLESESPRFVVRLQHRQRLTNKTIGFPGLYDAYAGENLLVAELLEGELPEGAHPLLVIDGAQIGMRAVMDAARPTWQAPLAADCKGGRAVNESNVELLLSDGSGSIPVSSSGVSPEAAPDKPEQVRPAKSLLSPVFWTGAAVAVVGFGVGSVSYFGFQHPAELAAQNTFDALGCPNCDAAAQAEVLAAYDKRGSYVPYTIAGFVVGGAGTALAVGALIWKALEKDEPNQTGILLLPVAGVDRYGVSLQGRF